MSTMFGYLCSGGYEVGNADRVSSYIRSGFLGGSYTAYCAECPAILDDAEFYSDPSSDGAPWYDGAFLDSADFLGVLPLRMELLPVLRRQMSNNALDGGTLGPQRLSARVLTFEGLLLARSGPGMAYGERWLNEALSGDACRNGCDGDEAIILPACPEASYEPSDRAFRSLVGVGCIDGPVFAPLGKFPEYKVQQVTFQLAASQPYLFTLAEDIISDDLSTNLAGSMTIPQWVDGGTFVIDITNEGVVDATDIVIEGRISLDGTCPVSGIGSSVAPSWTYPIATLGPGDRLIIDGRRRRVTYYDASCKEAGPGYHLIDFDGPWKNPDVGPCTTFCVSATIASGTVALDVNGHLRQK